MGALINNLLCLVRGLIRCRQICVVYPNVVIGRGVTVMPFAVLGRPPMSSGAAHLTNYWEYGPLIIEDGCIIGAGAVLYTGSHIGENTMVCDTACVREDVTIGRDCLIAQGVTVNRNTRIGDRVRIMDNAHMTGRMVVGDSCFIGMMVSFCNDNDMGRSDRPKDNYVGATVEQGVRIGHGARIHPGVRIARGAVVGANAVVTRNVGPGQRVMGVPARRR